MTEILNPMQTLWSKAQKCKFEAHAHTYSHGNDAHNQIIPIRDSNKVCGQHDPEPMSHYILLPFPLSRVISLTLWLPCRDPYVPSDSARVWRSIWDADFRGFPLSDTLDLVLFFALWRCIEEDSRNGFQSNDDQHFLTPLV